MNTEILNAHKEWKEAEDKAKIQEWEKGYKSRQAKALKLWKEFSLLCQKEGLKPVTTANELSGNKGKLTLLS